MNETQNGSRSGRVAHVRRKQEEAIYWEHWHKGCPLKAKAAPVVPSTVIYEQP